jgi:superoxide dismutase, Cu-Zn family
MNALALLAGVLLLYGTLASGQVTPIPEQETTRAELINAQGEKIGSATLTQGAAGVTIAVQVSKLPPGAHGFHIHAIGKCDAPGFTTAGDHLNPFKKEHGLHNAAGPHAGDLPNLVVGPDGTAGMEVVAPHVSFKEVPESLFPPGETALIIHANVDDDRTDPDGKAGTRLACGIIPSPKLKTTP